MGFFIPAMGPSQGLGRKATPMAELEPPWFEDLGGILELGLLHLCSCPSIRLTMQRWGLLRGFQPVHWRGRVQFATSERERARSRSEDIAPLVWEVWGNYQESIGFYRFESKTKVMHVPNLSEPYPKFGSSEGQWTIHMKCDTFIFFKIVTYFHTS